jgi:hypothetical protein
MELLAHISAPITKQADDEFQKQASEYLAFQPARRTCLTTVSMHQGSGTIRSGKRKQLQIDSEADTPLAKRANHTIVPSSPTPEQVLKALPEICPQSHRKQTPYRTLKRHHTSLLADETSTFASSSSSFPLSRVSRTPFQRLEDIQSIWKQRQKSSFPTLAPPGVSSSVERAKQYTASQLEDTQLAISFLDDGLAGFSQSQAALGAGVWDSIDVESVLENEENVDPISGNVSAIGSFSTISWTSQANFPLSEPAFDMSNLEDMQIQVPRSVEASFGGEPADQATDVAEITPPRGSDQSRSAVSDSFLDPESVISKTDVDEQPIRPGAKAAAAKKAIVITIANETSLQLPAQHEPQLETFAPLPEEGTLMEMLAALPMHISAPLPDKTFMQREGTETYMTKTLRNAVYERTDYMSSYQPVCQHRVPLLSERGYWRIDSSIWPISTQATFWTELQRYISDGRVGIGTCAWRNLDDDGGTLPGQHEKLGLVRVYCFGELIAPVFMLLRLVSNGAMSRSKATWVSSTLRDIVIEMP